jgi:hypothetical protein
MCCFSLFLLLSRFNPLNAELNPVCHLLALLGAHPIPHVSRIRVKLQIPPQHPIIQSQMSEAPNADKCARKLVYTFEV